MRKIVNVKIPTSEYYERTRILSQFYEDIRNYPLLTQEEEEQLFLQIKNGNKEESEQAFKKIIESNQRFVVSVAKRYANNDNLLDLISEGNIGLIEAIATFDINRKNKFISHAVWYIRRAINIYSMTNTLVKKSNATKTYHLLSNIRNRFLQKNERLPTTDEIIQILWEENGIKVIDSCDIVDNYFSSIDNNSINDDDDDNCEDYEYNRASSSQNDFDTIAENEFKSYEVKKMLSSLTDREQKVIRMFFGIGYNMEYDLSAIAKEVNLTTERVRQIKAEAIEKLKNIYNCNIEKAVTK